MKTAPCLITALGTLITVLNVCSAQEAYQREALNLHNQYRRTHHAPPLQMDNELNSLAVKCAQYYTGIRKIDHSCPYKKDAGENLAYSSWDQERNQFAGFCTKMWYDEGKTYNYNNPGFSPTTGHFTQLVWVNSQRFGFGYAHVNDYTVGVGLYRPSGNFRGEYEKNVLRP